MHNEAFFTFSLLHLNFQEAEVTAHDLEKVKSKEMIVQLHEKVNSMEVCGQTHTSVGSTPFRRYPL